MSHIIKESTILAIILVIRGNAKVKFSFFITISPGSLPKGIFILSKKSTPITTNIIPITIKILAN